VLLSFSYGKLRKLLISLIMFKLRYIIPPHRLYDPPREFLDFSLITGFLCTFLGFF